MGVPAEKSWIAVILSMIEEGFQGQHNQKRQEKDGCKEREYKRLWEGRVRKERKVKDKEENQSVNKALCW